jgi:hypothetical protein
MANRYWVGGTGTFNDVLTPNWSTTSGGAGGASVPSGSGDVAIFDVNSGTGNCAVDVSGSAPSVYFDSSTIIFDLFRGFNQGTSGSRNFTFVRGTLNISNVRITTPCFISNQPNTRFINFNSSGSIYVQSSTSSTVFDLSNATGFSYSGTSEIRIISTAAGTYTQTVLIDPAMTESQALNFGLTNITAVVTVDGLAVTKNLTIASAFSGTLTGTSKKVYGNLALTGGTKFTTSTNPITFAGTSGTKTVAFVTSRTTPVPIIFDGNCTWNFTTALTMTSGKTFTITNGTVNLLAGATYTVDLATTGTTLKYLASTTAGTQATISQASGTVAPTYLSIKDSNATGGAIFAASDPTNVNGGNNTGWTFGAVLTGLISESLSLQDASSPTKTLISAISEALGLADPSVVAAAFASAASEAITSADTPTAGTAFVSSILEGLVAADSTAVLKTFNVSISEPQTIEAAANVIAAFISAISEPTTIQESIIGVAAKIITDVTEAISVSDAQTAVVSFVSSSIESISVADSETVVKTQYAIVVEPLTLNEQQDVFAWVRVENDTPTSWSLIDNRQ